MTAHITVQPSGHRFTVEEGETLLEGALRSGLNMNYHCNSGSCGECQARVLEGEPGRRLPHDHVLGETARQQGVVLLCRTHADTDLVIEAREAHGVEDIPQQAIDTQVAKLEQPVEDVMVLHLRTPRSRTLRFLAGQYVTLHIDGLAPRSKSIASCPCNGMMLQFHVRRVAGDPFSEHVFQHLKPRQKIRVEGPHGEFVWDENSRRPVIFIAFETGFAPIKSLIEHAIALEYDQPMRLYWIARDRDGHYLANHCRAWQDALDNFEYHPLVSHESPPWTDEVLEELALSMETLDPVARGMVQAAAQVVAELPALEGHDVYVNGAETLLSPLRGLLLRHGLPASRLFVDRVRRHQ
ncbi:MAG: 2Fe-2S iron-sulfur cluster-binding protein [Gammaproteobacteria bacterium]|nr:2Fe-2S iron-sulfur cluster-binding protein [Gammaproteobacteria bacterium]